MTELKGFSNVVNLTEYASRSEIVVSNKKGHLEQTRNCNFLVIFVTAWKMSKEVSC